MPKVLLIEDDDETAQEITAELVHRGFDVDWAATGIAGLDKARAGEADAIIVDRLLPGVDGLRSSKWCGGSGYALRSLFSAHSVRLTTASEDCGPAAMII
jgi:DNA-binding NtrC family response regulator